MAERTAALNPGIAASKAFEKSEVGVYNLGKASISLRGDM
jgi:hypothetical protein